ncbi:MAG: hypothetical protein ABEJ72_07900, partial [Candidatus Aenigmatarchaeota archaeon]
MTNMFEKMLIDRLPSYEGEPSGIYEEEWDSLIILDGCRLDLYREVVGECDKRVSLGSSSPEFVSGNFSDAREESPVCVTANPYYHPSKFKELTGNKLENVFETVFHTYQTDWDDEAGTVRPEEVKRDALTAESLFPDRKKIIHFMQPHYPFLGSELETSGYSKDLGSEGEDIWDKAFRGEVSREQVW